MRVIFLISILCLAGCADAISQKNDEGSPWAFKPDPAIEEPVIDEPADEPVEPPEEPPKREFDIDDCWDAVSLPADVQRPIDFSSYRLNACVEEETSTGYFKVDIPAGFRLQLNEGNNSRPTLFNSCAEISPQLCQSRGESERLAQNPSNLPKREMVLEYVTTDLDPLNPIALVGLYPLAENISCNSPTILRPGEKLNADMRQGGEWDFNPCQLNEDQNATQFYQIDVPLGGNYYVEIEAKDPSNGSLRAQLVNIYADGFSCANPVTESCYPVDDLAPASQSLIYLRLGGEWGGGRDPARAIIAISGSTSRENSGYTINVRKQDAF